MGNLSFEPWFREALRCWGRSEVGLPGGVISQHDVAEFLSSWLDTICCPVVNMQWERRMQENETTHTVDRSSSTLPITLQFDSITVELPQYSFSALLRSWNQVDGMVAGITQAAPCLCLHIDRYYHMQSTNRVLKSMAAFDPEDPCLVPYLVDDSIACEFLEYTPVALQAHLGVDQAGHFRTALRALDVEAAEQKTRWLLCDDWSRPVTHSDLPGWFLRGINMVWVARTDLITLYQIASSADMSNQLLELLQGAQTLG